MPVTPVVHPGVPGGRPRVEPGRAGRRLCLPRQTERAPESGCGPTWCPRSTARPSTTAARSPSRQPRTCGSSAPCGSWPTWSSSVRKRYARRVTGRHARVRRSPRPGRRPDRRRSRARGRRGQRESGPGLLAPAVHLAPGAHAGAHGRRGRARTGSPRPRRRAPEVVSPGTACGVDPARAVRALADLGHHRLLTEGGPRLLGQLVAAGVLDELCLTISPMLTAGDAPAHRRAGPRWRSREHFALVSCWRRPGSCSPGIAAPDPWRPRRTDTMRNLPFRLAFAGHT